MPIAYNEVLKKMVYAKTSCNLLLCQCQLKIWFLSRYIADVLQTYYVAFYHSKLRIIASLQSSEDVILKLIY